MPRPPSITLQAPSQRELRVMWADAELDELGSRTVQAAVIGTSAQTIDRWLNNDEERRAPPWVESWLQLWIEAGPEVRKRVKLARLGMSEVLAE